MNFRQRILRYLIGVTIGTVVVFFMFPDHDWLGWTPNKRVMESIREARFNISPHAQCEMQCLGLTNEQLQLARREGKIDFGKSRVNTTPLSYHLDYGNLDLQIELADTLATLADISSEGVSCTCP